VPEDSLTKEILGVSHVVFSVPSVVEAESGLALNGYAEHGSNASCPNHPAKALFIAGPMAETAEMKLVVAANGSPAIEMTCEPAGAERSPFFEAILTREPLCGAEVARAALRDDAVPGLRGFRRPRSLSKAGGVGALILHCRSTQESLTLWHALGMLEEPVAGDMLRIAIRGLRTNNRLLIYLVGDRSEAAVGHLNDGGIVCLSFFCRDADRLREGLARAGYDVGECFTLSPFDVPLRIFFMRNLSGEIYEFLSVSARQPTGEA
jgi:hypothetical protein